MKTKNIICLIIGFIVFVILGVSAYAYSITVFDINEFKEKHVLNVYDDDNLIATYKMCDFGVDPNENDKSYNINEDTCVINKDEVYAFTEVINESRDNRIVPYLYTDGKILKYRAYDKGNKIDSKKLADFIIANASNTLILDVNLNDFLLSYIDDEYELYNDKAILEDVNKYNNFLVSYTNGEEFTIVDFFDYLELTKDGVELYTDEDTFYPYLRELVEERTDSYDTYYKEFDFNSTTKGAIKVKTKESMYSEYVYGSIVNDAEETKFVLNALEAKSSHTERIPYLEKDGGFEIGNTYVEVSISDQHLWYYKDGELIMDSGIVSGWKGKSDTPTGVFTIFEKAHGVHFPVGGSSKNWMKFTTKGHGLHDATWRGNYEFSDPNSYVRKGSHGCVNLPLDFSTKLYNEVENGTIVVVY